MITAKRYPAIADATVLNTLKLTEKHGIISFAGGTPSPEVLPGDLVRKAAAQHPINLQYSPAQGLLPLREELAEQLCRNWDRKINADQILITSGSQQALDLISRTFIDPGETVLVENPTYFVALYAFNAYSPVYHPINLDTATWPKAKLAYLVSTFQNPTGMTIPLSKRREIARVLCDRQLLLIEDDPYSELHFYNKPPLPIAAIVPEHVIYVTTFSKTVGPAMRLGVVVGSSKIISQLSIVKTGMDLCTSGWMQSLALSVITNSQFIHHLKNARSYYQHKAEIMQESLTRYMPSSVSWTKPRGGLFIWVTLPKHIDTQILYEISVKNGVAFIPGFIFDPERHRSHCLRLSYAIASDIEIKRGICILSKLIKTL